MKDKTYQKHIQRIREEAKQRGITDEELSSFGLDGIFGRGKMTKSTRIMHIAEIAYYRGMMRGVRWVREAETPITLRDGVEYPKDMTDEEYVDALERALIFMCAWQEALESPIFRDYVLRTNDVYEQLPLVQGSDHRFAIKELAKLEPSRPPTTGFLQILQRMRERLGLS